MKLTKQQELKFRKWLKENDEGAGDERLSQHQVDQEKYRERQTNSAGWEHAAFFGPPSAIKHIKSSWEEYRKHNPQFWKDSDNSEDKD